ncbi:MAG: beta-N-acetylhexosaminidase, partial [Chitinophagaceae bacterium]
MMHKIILILFLSLLCMQVFPQPVAVNIIPRPQTVSLKNGYFTLTQNTKLHADAGFENSSSFFRQYLHKFYALDITPGASPKEGSRHETIISLKRSQASANSKAYTLLVSPEEIEIRSGSDTGIFYGIQTLIQLLPVVKNAEKAGTSYRGIHLDVARHFFDTAYLKKFIDLLALHKFNKFHWHLTDDQGWRMEVKKYPNLTVTGSCRDQTLLGRFGSDVYDGMPHCGFYTVEEMKGLVNYAARRYITIIPEIDMPGHTTAALASYPFLGCTKGPYKVSQTWGVHKEVMCAGNDSTYEFIKEVLKEVAGIFPSTLIHIGGDEVPKDRWKACPVCQARKKKEGLKNEDELQSYFINRVHRLVRELGRTMIGWDEILEGKNVPGTVIMNWRGRKFADEALRLGHPVIFSPDNPMYLNFQQSRHEDSVTQGGYNPLENVYGYDPIKSNTANELVLGIQANLWTEYIASQAKLEYMALPRLSAVAEAAWSSQDRRRQADAAT